MIKISGAMTLFFIAGVATAAPNVSQVSKDCQKMADDTVMFTQVTQPDGFERRSKATLQFVTAKLEGTSMDRNVAEVIAICNVKYHGSNTNIYYDYLQAKNGFEMWFGEKGIRKLEDGDVKPLRVHFFYRKFDTGWQFEGHK